MTTMKTTREKRCTVSGMMVDDVDFVESKGEEAGEDRPSGRRAEAGTRQSSGANGRRNTAASTSRESEQ